MTTPDTWPDDDETWFEDNEEYTVACPHCNGTGEDWSKAYSGRLPCKYCNGQGVVGA